MPVPLAELLTGAGALTQQQLQDAVSYQRTNGGGLGGAVTALGFVTEDEIVAIVSRRFRVPAVDLTRIEFDADVAALIPAATARKHQVVPLSRSGATLTVAVTDPGNVVALDDIKFLTGCNVEPRVAAETAVAAAVRKLYGAAAPRAQADPTDAAADLGGMLQPAAGDVEILDAPNADVEGVTTGRQGGEAPVVRLVNALLAAAIQRGASDVHLEPYDQEFRIRFRIDGMLYPVAAPAVTLRDAVISRIKIMANLDIAEKRLPQDGRLKARFRDRDLRREIDLRVSSLPTLFGEKIVLRLLDRERLTLDMTKLGFDERSLDRFESAIRSPRGMVLVTGPTGSGKTNTLYSSIARINVPHTNILTAEDPVEFNMRGVNQVQIREGIGLTFAAALRSFLRQDPNVILVGEIRDGDTAEVAVKAALTGHLVLSTLHTNDAPSSVARLLNMGVEPFLVTSSLNVVCAQRLVRCICRQCAAPAPLTPAALRDIGFSDREAGAVAPRAGQGCAACNGTGYKGRVGLFEVMVVSPALQQMILAGASTYDLSRQALAEGMVTLRRSGLRKIADGVTTVDEIVRETTG